MTNTDTLQNLREEVQAGLNQVDALSFRIGTLLASVQAENIRLTLENRALKRALEAERGKLHELRQAVKLLQKQEQAFRQELIREMTYTAELTEGIESGEWSVESGEEQSEEGDWDGCVWEVGQ